MKRPWTLNLALGNLGRQSWWVSLIYWTVIVTWVRFLIHTSSAVPNGESVHVCQTVCRCERKSLMRPNCIDKGVVLRQLKCIPIIPGPAPPIPFTFTCALWNGCIFLLVLFAQVLYHKRCTFALWIGPMLFFLPSSHGSSSLTHLSLVLTKYPPLPKLQLCCSHS